VADSKDNADWRASAAAAKDTPRAPLIKQLHALLTYSSFLSADVSCTTRRRITSARNSSAMTGSMPIMARSQEPACANAEGRAFSKNTNVHGITTYVLLVSIRLPRPRVPRKESGDGQPQGGAPLRCGSDRRGTRFQQAVFRWRRDCAASARFVRIARRHEHAGSKERAHDCKRQPSAAAEPGAESRVSRPSLRVWPG
jgi:hypothetical protein